MKLAIGSDEVGYELKEKVIETLNTHSDIEVSDFGVRINESIDYPDIAEKVALSIKSQENERGILICGTGIGMAIVANKVPGVRAAQVYDPYSAERSRKSNNAQVMTLGALTMGFETAKYLVEIWLNCDFSGGRSLRKVEKINQIDMSYHGQKF